MSVPRTTAKLYTYKDVAGLFNVHPKTVARWFRRRRLLRLNHQTVRITQEQLDQFTSRSCSLLKKA